LEVLGVDTSPYRQMLSQVKDPVERKKYLDDFLNTTEEGRTFLERYQSTPEMVDLGNRKIMAETNRNRSDFGKEIARYDVGVSPDQRSRERIADADQAAKASAAKPNLSATEQKHKIELETNLSRADGALDALNIILSENLIPQSPAGIPESIGSVAQRSVNAPSKQNAALARLGILADKILKNVERFEGPQGVYDVQSYEKAAGDLANPNKSDAERLAAAETLVLMMNKAKETTQQQLAQYQNAGAGAGAGATGVTDFNDLSD